MEHFVEQSGPKTAAIDRKCGSGENGLDSQNRCRGLPLVACTSIW
jgi:hypothetical protein